MKFPWQRKTEEPEPVPSYWKPADRVTLVWTFGVTPDQESTFTVEAPTAYEAQLWAKAASRTGKHAQVNAHLSPNQPRVVDPLL